jgi:predicted O-methyltransferase YrrM
MAEPLLPERLEQYLESLVPPRPAELAKMEEEGRRTRFPIIGPACGHLCYLVARLTAARQVFEMGSGYGYSTAWFARAVVENGGGRVVHVVWDEALSLKAIGHLSALGYADVMTYRVDEAVHALRQEPGPFDLIFLDIDKEAYPEALEVIRSKLRPGGVLLADNLLRRGLVLDGSDHAPATEGVRTLTQLVMAGEDWIGSIVPIRDGLLVAFRR